MRLILVISTVVCLCSGQRDDSSVLIPYGTAPAYNQVTPSRSSYGQAPSYGVFQGPPNVFQDTYGPPTVPSYGSRQNEQSYVEHLKALNSALDGIDTTQSRQEAQTSTIRDNANVNIDFANNFNVFTYNEIMNEQYSQNARLDRAAETAQILTDLAQTVAELSETVDSLSDRVEKEREKDDISRFEINKIQSANIPRNNRRDITQRRFEGFSFLKYLVCDIFIPFDIQSLDIAEPIVRRIIDSTNRQRRYYVDLTLPTGRYREATSVTFDPPFVGAPAFDVSYPTGFKITNPRGYDTFGYESIYGFVEEEIWNTGAEITSVDMSSGGFHFDEFVVEVDKIYFDNTFYNKTELDGIVTQLLEGAIY